MMSSPSSTSCSDRCTCSPVSPYYNGVMLYMAHISEEKLQRFKQLLMDEQLLPGSKHIVQNQLQRASWAEVVHLLVERFRGRLAWDVAHVILHKMDQKATCLLVQKELNSILPTLEIGLLNPREIQSRLEEEEPDELQRYKLHEMEKNSPVWNKSVWPGNQISFLYQEIPKHKELLACLFLPKKPHGRPPKTVVIEGIPGIGKTTLARRVMLLWARKEFYPHKFRYAFYFRYKELVQTEHQSLADLLEHKGLRSRALVSKILSEPDQVLLVLDDFEKFPSHALQSPEDVSKDWNQKLPGFVLLMSLLSKRMLAEATLLLLVRPDTWHTIKPFLKHPSLVTLLGFNRIERIKYFSSYFSNSWQGNVALNFAKKNCLLFSMCQVPVVCWLVCCSLQEQIMKNRKFTSSNTTIVFIWYLSTLLRNLFQNVSHWNQVWLEGLCNVAAQGMWNVKCVFNKKDFETVKMKKASITAFLHANILQRVEGQEDCYVFSLFIFQEFFAAMFYVLCFPQRLNNCHILSRMAIQSLLANSGRFAKYVTHMAVFLFGFFTPSCVEALEKGFKCKVSLSNKKKVLRVAAQLNKYNPPPPCCGIPKIMYCLFENKEEEYVRQVLKGYHTVALTLKSHEDIYASAFCLMHCRDLKEMKLTLSQRFFTEWWSGPPDLCVTIDSISYCCCWKIICSAFRRNRDLEVLEMTDSAMEPPFMELFAAALKHPQCRLQRLCFKRVERSVIHEDFFQALSENQNLRHLGIEHTEMDLAAVQSLGRALKSPLCLLQNLRLESCMVSSPRDWVPLAYSLPENVHLTSLMMKGNALELFGVHCRSVSHLRILSLENCNLTESSCESIAFSLSRSVLLTHLNLAENPLTDKGVKHIWKALGCLVCPLKRLVLRKCGMTSACCSRYMFFALKNNKSLNSLDLSYNKLGNNGIILLCEALRESDSSLQVLQLERCLISFLCGRALASMISRHRKLGYLDLSGNDIKCSDIMTFGSAYMDQRRAEELVKVKRSDPRMEYTRLMGPQVTENILQIVED